MFRRTTLSAGNPDRLQYCDRGRLHRAGDWWRENRHHSNVTVVINRQGRLFCCIGVLLCMLLLPDGMGAQGVEDAIDPLATTGPTFFSDAVYVGNPVTLPVGSYKQSALAVLGIANNSVSSIRVQPGYKVEAFDSSDLLESGSLFRVTHHRSPRRAFDNRISSVRISKITIGATFYQLCGKSGYNVTLPPGNYTTTNLATWGIKDNQISEIVPAAEEGDRDLRRSLIQWEVATRSRLDLPGQCGRRI